MADFINLDNDGKTLIGGYTLVQKQNRLTQTLSNLKASLHGLLQQFSFFDRCNRVDELQMLK